MVIWLQWVLNTSSMPFALIQRPWRTAVCHALGIPSCHVSEDTHLETIHANKFSLTPRRIPVERKTAAKQEVDQEMVAREESKSDAVSDAESDGQGCRTTPPLRVYGC